MRIDVDAMRTDDLALRWQNRAMSERGPQPPLLSICIPFFQFDVLPLFRQLLNQAARSQAAIEIILVDDASGNPELIEQLCASAADTRAAVHLAVFGKNQGRARVRNYLTATAVGTYVLWLDCDMSPDSDSFLARYLERARASAEDVVVGGCSYQQLGPVPPSQLLYFYHSNRTQCTPLEVRREAPLRYVFTNNMMIRRELLARLSFDPGYVGWGYEDTDLAIRAARLGAVITHIDNTATHLGLIGDDAVIGKYRDSAPNFARLVRKFPQEAHGLPAYKVARRLARIPLPYRALSSLFERFVRTSLLPVKLRYVCLQCMKLALYSRELRLGQAG